MKYSKRYLLFVPLFILFLVTLGIYSTVSSKREETKYLTVAFLNIGQGDAIYIEASNGKQMLIDGGPDAKVIQKLAEVMPFGDRSIDVLVETHADSDHITGFSYVLDDYKVSDIIENGVPSKNRIYQKIEQKVKKDKVKKIIANNKMRIILDKDRNIYFDILFPDKDISKSKLTSNDGSIVGKLVYGKESFMLTGDATIYTENMINWNENNNFLHSQVLKLGHHGSKTSSSVLWLKDVKPQIAIISVGRNNRYNLPNPKILNRLKNLHIPYLETFKEGNIIFETDGVNLFREK